MTLLNYTIASNGSILGAGPFPLVGIPGTLLFGDTVTVSAPQIIPLQPLAAQILSVTLNGQDTTLSLYFRQTYAPVEAEVFSLIPESFNQPPGPGIFTEPP